MMQKRFLFLQGMCSPFFARLARALRINGHSVRKVNFSFGDSFYWRQGDAVAFRGPMESLPGFYAGQYARYGISDIVLFGDCRPVHRPAIELAREQGVRVYVFEEGYFRPFWVTLERDGVNGYSSLPKDPEWYRRESGRIMHDGHDHESHEIFQPVFWQRVTRLLGYHAWFGLNPFLHWGVRHHMPCHPVVQCLGYVGCGVKRQIFLRQFQKLEAQLVEEAPQWPFYLLPLQLNSDSQIVHHSPFSCVAQAMLHVLDSFARCAPPRTRLVVKLHPLDPGLVNYCRRLFHAARRLGVEDRVFFLESGSLPGLLKVARGVVAVNSTVGASALIHNLPTMALGQAIYDVPGLTFQGSLDNFWSAARPPDSNLFRHFRNVVIWRTQVNGGFYCNEGMDLAVKNSINRLIMP